MHRFLERMDATASTVVPLAYLAGMMLGTAAYFTGLVADGGLAVGLALAIAVELHGFLEQRRVRALWGEWMRKRTADAWAALRAHAGILCALVAFQAYNGAAFLSASWHVAPDWLPAPIQVAIRALILPALFLASGALSALHIDAGEVLASASVEMQHYTIGRVVRQWRHRIRRDAGPAWWQFWRRGEQGIDLAPVAVALFEDAGDADGARRIKLIAAGLDTAEGRTLPAPAPEPEAAPAVVTVEATPAEDARDERMARLVEALTGVVTALPVAIAAALPAPTPTPEPPPPPAKKTRKKREPVITFPASAVRTPRDPDQLASYATMAREAYANGATSIDKMVAATDMGRTAAASWVRTLKAETAAKASAPAPSALRTVKQRPASVADADETLQEEIA